MPEGRRGARAHDETLTGEHRLGDAGQAIFAVLFAAVWVADAFFLRATTGGNGVVPFVVRAPIGVAVLIISGWMARTGLRIVFGEKREKPEVIRKGVFGVVRHPIYLSEILLYLGLLLLSLSLAATAVWIAATLFLVFLCRHEERLLLKRFGEEYARYMRDVPMLFPRLRRK
ncbi:MAG: isoprenylcysteine carboxylmethyltransferase family protein [Candidatus Eisenbacteria bacterium]|nr:isoprenylcysteine carboxylmethyltransferase family protein [Candidatus Eisenbacteria bacterium]